MKRVEAAALALLLAVALLCTVAMPFVAFADEEEGVPVVTESVVTDVCPNMDGVQLVIFPGFEHDENGNCVPTPEVCPILDLVQSMLNEFGIVFNFSETCGEDTPPPATENTEALCSDGIDNDGDQLIDLADPDCADFVPDEEDDVCPEMDGVQTDPEECDDDSEEPTDACPDMDGVQTSVEECDDSDEETPGGGGGGTTGGSPPPSNESNENNSGGGGGGGGGMVYGSGPTAPGYQVGGTTGAPTQGEVLGASCTPYLNDYLRIGRANNPEEVKKLQTFLNEYMNAGLPVTGFFGPLTFKAVEAFQIKESASVLAPWVSAGLHESPMVPTGYVYKTTKRQINMIKCAALNLPIPQLP